jgi:hypothetical protein
MTKYRVTWDEFDENDKLQPHERIFEILEQGWDFYQNSLKGRIRRYNAKWEHVRDDD